jgi:hypothetical protein
VLNETAFELGRIHARRRPLARHVGSPYPGHVHTEALEYQAVRDSRRRHCAARAHDARGKPRPVTRGLCALAGGRTAIRHWPLVRRTSSPPLRPCLSSCRPRRCVATASTRPQGYKTPCLLFLARPSRPSPPAISAAGDLVAPLAPVVNL